MKHFEARGLWYPTDDKENAVGGTLTFDKDGLHLVLLGSFRQGWSTDVERYPIIHGVVDNSPYGAYATMIDCFRSNTNFNMAGVTSERIYCKKGVVGNFYLPEGTTYFESLELDYTYLTEWVEYGGMTVERKLATDNTYTVTYRKPNDVEFPFGLRSLTLGFQFNASDSTHKKTLTEGARLLIEPMGELTPETLGLDHIRTIQDLISFATDTPNAVEEIAYRGEKDELGIRPRGNLIYDAIFRLEDRKKSFHSIDMLFTYKDCFLCGINIFQKWSEFVEKHREFTFVYFGNIYAKPRYLVDRFARVMAAFTLLSSNLGTSSDRAIGFLSDAEAALAAHYADDERVFLGHILPNASKVEMPLKLLGLLRENADLMSGVIADIPIFVRSVSDTLSSIERRAVGVRPALEDGDIHYAIEKMRMLIKILILKELGFNDESVKVLIERNQKLNLLRTV